MPSNLTKANQIQTHFKESAGLANKENSQF